MLATAGAIGGLVVARRADIVVSVLAHVGRLTAAAIAAGIAAGIATTRLLSSLLYGVTPLDWRTFAAVAALLTSFRSAGDRGSSTSPATSIARSGVQAIPI